MLSFVKQETSTMHNAGLHDKSTLAQPTSELSQSDLIYMVYNPNMSHDNSDQNYDHINNAQGHVCQV